MNRQIRTITIIVISVLILAVISLFLVFILSPKKIKEADKIISTEKPIEKVNLGLLETNYKSQTKVILNNYLRSLEFEDLSVQNIEQFKEQLFGLTVPRKFKDLHLDLVLAIGKMGDYLQTGELNEKNESQKLINEAKANYIWLN